MPLADLSALPRDRRGEHHFAWASGRYIAAAGPCPPVPGKETRWARLLANHMTPAEAAEARELTADATVGG